MTQTRPEGLVCYRAEFGYTGWLFRVERSIYWYVTPPPPNTHDVNVITVVCDFCSYAGAVPPGLRSAEQSGFQHERQAPAVFRQRRQVGGADEATSCRDRCGDEPRQGFEHIGRHVRRPICTPGVSTDWWEDSSRFATV